MPITVPEIETTRLRLRAYREEDVPAMVRHLAPWEVVRYTSTIPHPYRAEDARKYVLANRFLAEDGLGVFAIERKADGCWMGAISLDRRMKDPRAEPELGYVLGRDFWGQHYISEAARPILHYAFASLRLPLVIATVFPDNLPSEKVLRGLGFPEIGLVRVLSRGRECDLRKFSLSRRQWEELQA